MRRRLPALAASVVLWSLALRTAVAAGPFVPLAKLVPKKPQEAQDFGLSVAIDGDTIVVGSNQANNGAGAIYVYVRSGPDWSSMTEVAQLSATPDLDEKVGASVAIQGDTIVAGAFNPGLGSITPGAALVFVRPPGGWVSATQSAVLTASDGNANPPTFDMDFGYSVGLDGDTIVVGATLFQQHTGAAYVFVKPAGGWVTATETAKLTSSTATINDELGWSVAVRGDTVLASAPTGYPVDVPGKVLLFTRPGGGWSSTTETAVLTPSDGAPGDYFGYFVAMDGGTIVVGAPDHDVASYPGNGAAYVFVEPGGGWATATETAQLLPSTVQMDTAFGTSVAIAGDRIVVGAPGFDSETGAALVFDKPPTGWAAETESAMLRPTDPTPGTVEFLGDFFGNGVAVDPGGAIVVTDPNDDLNNVAIVGTAFAFEAVPSAVPCPPAPVATCAVAPNGQLALAYKRDTPYTDVLQWKLLHGPELHRADFGDPLSATGYTMCVYDDGALSAAAYVVPDFSRWALSGTDAYKYLDKSKVAFVDGVQQVQLKGGAAGKAKILLKGRGDDLPDPTAWQYGFGTTMLNAMTSVVVQLQQTGGGCYETSFTPAQVQKNLVLNGKGLFKAKK
jgi:FG-GAP repeat protein